MSDGPSGTEQGVPQPKDIKPKVIEDFRIVDRRLTAPVEAQAALLVGRPGVAEFRLPDGKILSLETSSHHKPKRNTS